MLAHARRIMLAGGLLLLGASALAADENWPRWRGPRGDGHAAEPRLPSTWSEKDIAWQTRIEGRGQSSPILWGEQIFLTTANDTGQQRAVVAVDRRTGKINWQRPITWSGTPEPLHKMNTWATPSCVTDGQVVVAFFGRAGLHAFTVDGQPLWSQDLGTFESPWGTAACPVIVGDLVIQNGDADKDAFIAAFRKDNGQPVWRTPRPNKRGWSTPVLLHAGDRDELVVNGHEGVTSYNPLTGQQLWFCKSFNGRGEPTATPGKELIYMVNGLSGDVYAVRPGGEGDVTSSRMAWHTPRKSGRDLPSPVLIDNYLLVCSMGGICTCYDAQTGAVIWNERLEGNYSASPIAANGLAYFQAEDGTVVVVRPGPKLDVVARNALPAAGDEIFRCSLAASQGQLFIRSDRVLYCIGQRN